MLGTFVYLGLSIGSLIGAKLFTYASCIKYILSVSLIFSAITLIIFSMTSNFELGLTMRLLAGFFEVFITIFTPVWADTFGSQREKSVWMTVLQTCPTFGIFIGFALTSFFNVEYYWELTFYLQVLLIFPLLVGYLSTPIEYLDLDQAV